MIWILEIVICNFADAQVSLMGQHVPQQTNHSLPRRCCDADILNILKKLIAETKYSKCKHHVYGHLDKITSCDMLLNKENMNYLVDTLADVALIQSIVLEKYITSTFPFEENIVKVSSAKVTVRLKITCNEVFQDSIL